MPDAASDAAAVAPTRAGARLRVALFGGFGIGNFGNDASLEAALDFMRKAHPEADVTVVCTRPDEVSESFNIPVLPTTRVRPVGVWKLADTILLKLPSTLANWTYTFGALRKFDVVLVPGTGIFDDFRDTPWGWPSRLLRWSMAARLSGVCFVHLSVGAGPILSPVSRLLMKWAAQLASFRSYRDANSRDYMQNLGVDERRSPVLPDVAFLLTPAVTPAVTAPSRAVAKPTIGVGIMNYSGWRKVPAVYRNYVEKHVQLIEWLLTEGYGVQALVGQTTDWETVREIEAMLGCKLSELREDQLDSFHDVMGAVTGTDVVVASRYHVQVAALQQGRPVISLSYGPKNDALLAQAGLEAFTQDIHAIDLDRLKGQITTLVRERDQYAGVVRERVAGMQTKLRAALNDMQLLG